MTPENLRELSRLLVRQLGLLDNYCGDMLLTPVQAHTMIELEPEPMTVSEMSLRLNVDKSNASRTLATLLNQGVVESVPHPTDGRSMVFRLTDAGREKLKVLHCQLNGQVQAFMEQLEADEQAALESSLRRYIRAMQVVPRQSGYTFRELTALDNASVAAVIRRVSAEYGLTGECGYGVTDPFLDRLSEVYAPDNCEYWVIEREYRVLGGGGIAPLKGEEELAELQKMYFLPELREGDLPESLL